MTNTKKKGNKAEAVILSEFVKRGIPTLLPFGDNEKYDLVVEINGEFKSIQIKYGRYRNGCVIASVTHRTGVKRLKEETYRGKVDYIAVWCEELDTCYLLDLKTFTNKSKTQLRVGHPKNNKILNTIVWAKDHELGIIIDKIM